jgi:4-amino-4-deoxy-L-arabinose transferase-like glycosyltransferase
MKKILAAMVLLGIAALYGSFLNDKLGFAGDPVERLQLAEALRNGAGFTLRGRFAITWPPVAPVAAALGQSVFGTNLSWLKGFDVVLALLGLAAAGVLLWRNHERWIGWAAVVLSAVSFPFIYTTVGVGMEPPYILFSLLGLLLATEALRHGQRWPAAIGAGLCFGLAVLSRAVGVSLFAGLGLYILIRLLRRETNAKVAAAILLIALCPPALWYGYSWLRTGTTNLASYVKLAERKEIVTEHDDQTTLPLLHRVKDNAVGYVFIFSNPDASLRMKAQARLTPKGIVSAAIVLLAFSGYTWHLVGKPRLLECYLLCYGGVLLVFSWYDIRYLVPVFPFLFYYMGFSAHRIFRWTAERVRLPKLATAATVAFFGMLILANLAFSIASPQAKRLRSPEYHGTAKEVHQAALWVKQHHPDAVVMTRWANMVWYWTRMKVVPVPPVSDPGEMWRRIEEREVGTIIADPDEFSGVTTKYLMPALQAYPERVELVATFGRTKIYRVQQP